MALDLAAVLEAVEGLSADDRREVADRLHELEHSEPLSDAMKAELDRRLALSEAHPEAGRPWDEVYAELKARR